MPQVSDIRIPIVLDGVQCGRTENKLDECRSLNFVQECSHSMDAGADCNITNGEFYVQTH